MKRKLGIAAALVVALAVSGYAQKKPDFSGTWTMDQEKSDPAPAATAGGGGGGGGRMGGGMGSAPMTIKQTEDSLAIERTMRGNPVTTTYKLDGTETEIAMGQATAKAKAKWDGEKLVIETTRVGQDGTAVTTSATYGLNADGTLTIENKGANGTRKVVYKKTT